MRALILVLLAAPPAFSQTASIDGMVVHEVSGAPVAGARVVALAMPGNTQTPVLTDAAGHFHMEGSYSSMIYLGVVRAGYLPVNRHFPLKPGENVTGLQIALPPQAVIAGIVEDEDGFPVADSQVAAFRRDAKGALTLQRATLVTNDRGEFRISGLPAGKYDLRVEGGSARQWDERYAGTQEAQSIEVAEGEEHGGVTIRLQKLATAGVMVQGRVALPPGFAVAPSGPRAQVNLTSAELPGLTKTEYATLAPDGTFTFRNVQPGKYQILPSLPPPYGLGYTRGQTAVESNLEVGSSDISGLVLDAAATIPVDISGTVTFGETTNRAPVIIQLMQQNAVQAQTASTDDGTFVLHSVVPGKYKMTARSTEGSAALAVRLGETELTYGEIDVKGPNPGALAIHVGSPSARVTGVVLNGAGTYVLFRCTKPVWQASSVGRANAEGRFAISLAPGEYQVWTAAAVPPDFYEGREAPTGPSVTVTVVEGENPPLRLVR